MQDKTKLISAAQKTYFSYLKLDFARDFLFEINGESTSLSRYVHNFLNDNNFDALNGHRCNLNGNDYTLEVREENGKPTLRLTTQNPSSAPNALKTKENIEDYTPDEALRLLMNTSFIIPDSPDSNGNLQFGLDITLRERETQQIGGPDKLPLYRSHLVTLHKKINILEKDGDHKAMLVALTTGAGKTFDQALWYLTLQIAQTNGIFALPDQLVPQLKADFKRLLPTKLVDEIVMLRNEDEGENANAEAIIRKLPTKKQKHVRRGSLDRPISDDDSKPKFVMASYEKLLDEHFQTLLDADPELLTLIFDEQHLVMLDESRRVKLKALAKKLLSLFLTATPNKETFKISTIVAVMSALQKKREGHGDFPKVVKPGKVSLFQKLQQVDIPFKEKTSEWLELWAESTFEQQPLYTPPSHIALDAWRHHIHIRDNGTIQLPSHNKLLFLTDDVDELFNIFLYLDVINLNYRGNNQSFRNGQKCTPENFREYNELLASEFNHQLTELDTENRMPVKALKTLTEQLDKNIFHNMVDLLISQVTGYSVIKINQEREKNPESLLPLFLEKLEHITSTYNIDNYFTDKLKYNEETNPTGIDEDGARTVAKIFNKMIKKFGAYNEDKQAKFVQNWRFEESIFADFPTQCKHSGYEKTFGKFAKKHRFLFVMQGKHQEDIPLENGTVYSSFRTESIPVHNVDGTLTDEVKKHKLTTMQILDEYSYMELHHATEAGITEEIADNYFKLGLVGIYASNKKGEGFNDLELHTAINTISTPHDHFNAPSRMIQLIGRLRGLDTTITPTLFQTINDDCKSTFDLKLLETTEDYYSLYFKAEKRAHSLFIKRIAQATATEIVKGLHQTLNNEDKIDPAALKWQTLRCIVRALQLINNNNSHKIKLSRRQLGAIVKHTQKEIKLEIKRLENPSKTSGGLSHGINIALGVGFIISFFRNLKTNLTRTGIHLRNKRELRQAMREEKSQDEIENLRAKVIYGKILSLNATNIHAQGVLFPAFMQQITRSHPRNPEDMSMGELSMALQENARYVLRSSVFLNTMKLFFGRFTQEELTLLIMKVQGQGAEQDTAHQLAKNALRLLSLLRNKDYDTINQEFITAKGEDKPIILLDILELISELAEEMKEIHESYNKNTNNNSALKNAIKCTDGPNEECITTIQTPKTKNRSMIGDIADDYSSFHGMMKGIKLTGPISGLENSAAISNLQRIHDHILKPIKRSANLTEVGAKASRSFRAWREKTQDAIDQWRAKRNTEAAENNDQDTASKQCDKGYEQAAFDVGVQISQLTRFRLEDVLKPDCKVDAIQDVFDYIDDQASGLSVR